MQRRKTDHRLTKSDPICLDEFSKFIDNIFFNYFKSNILTETFSTNQNSLAPYILWLHLFP